MYRQRLADFRDVTSTARQFLRTFQENPESHIIQDKLNDINDRYSRLKQRCNEHTQRILQLLGLHEKYRFASETVTTWIEEVMITIQDAEKQPIAEDSSQVQEQIDQLRVSLLQ